MTAAVQSGTSAVTLAAKAPIQIAGQSESPRRRSAAWASPVGAQTVVTCSATNAIVNPRRAVATYATASAAPSPRVLRRAFVKRPTG